MVSGSAFKAAARLQQAAAEGEILVGQGPGGSSRTPLSWSQPRASPSRASRRHQPRGSSLAWSPGLPSWPVASTRPWSVGRPNCPGFEPPTTERCGSGRLTASPCWEKPASGSQGLPGNSRTTVGSETWVLTGHCPAYGDGITFWPLREVVVEAAGGIGHGTRSWICWRLWTMPSRLPIRSPARSEAAATPGRPDALFPALRRFFEALARERPVAVIFEDVHWAQPTLLDLVEYLADGTPAPVFLLCLARPELLEQRGAWAGGHRRRVTSPRAAGIRRQPEADSRPARRTAASSGDRDSHRPDRSGEPIVRGADAGRPG